MDRLGELKNKRPKYEIDEDTKDEENVTDAGAGELSEQVKKYGPVKDLVKQVRDSTNRVKELRDKLSKEPNESARKVIMGQVNAIFTQAQAQGSECKKRLDNLNTENVKNEKENPTAATTQARKNLHLKNVKDFQLSMKEFSEASDDFRKSLQETTRRQLKNAGLSDKEAEKVVESGNAAQVLQQAMVDENLDDLVQEIESRHDDIVKLERQVMEVAELFKDLATLVDVQQDHIDTIEHRIDSAKVHVDKGATHVVEAEKLQKTSRKRTCVIIVIVICVLIAILAPLLAKSFTHS